MQEDPSRIRILIVSANRLICIGIRMILENHRPFVVVGEVTGSKKAIEVAAREQPQVVLLDADVSGVEIDHFISDFQKAVKNTLVIVLSDLEDEELTRKALISGAAGVVLKIQPPAVLIALIESLCSGEAPVHQQPPASPSKSFTKPLPASAAFEDQKIKSLTSREREVIRLVGKGLRNKDIADRLCVSETTVRHHLTSIFAKLDVTDRQKLLILAYQHGIIDLTAHTDVPR